MNLKAVVKCLQFFGAFPVIYEERFTSNNEINIKLSKKYLCCAIVQFVFMSSRMYSLFNMLHSKVTSLGIVIYAVENSWPTAVLLLSLKNVSVIYKCVQGCSETLPSSETHMRTFRSFAFLNLCLQTGSAALLIFSKLPRSNSEAALTALSVLSAIFIVALVNYFILTILKTTVASYTRVNRRLTAFANMKPVKEFATTELVDLVQKHWQTGNIILHLNRAFGLHILFFSGLTFVKFTLVIYFVSIINITFIEGKKQTNLGIFFMTLYSVSTLLVDFLQMCIASQQVSCQRYTTLVLLHRLLRRTSDSMSKGLILQIRVFVYQVRSRQLELTACEFFYVNRPLFYGMVMVVISYFILLVQFKILQ